MLIAIQLILRYYSFNYLANTLTLFIIFFPSIEIGGKV